MSDGSVQVRVDLSAIRDSVACFGTGLRAEYCAVMEIAGSQQSLAKVDDAKQEEALAAYAQFLNSLTFPIQLVVQVHPVDLAWYVVRVEERARSLAPVLVAVARDHAAFVQSLTRQRTLLERRTYVVVLWSPATELGNARSTALVWRLLRPRRRQTTMDDDQGIQDATASRQLTDRCDAISRQLSRAGLRTARLDDVGLAQLYHLSWAPEIARTQRLRRELADYTALVVGADVRPVLRPAAEAGRNRPSLEQGSARSRVPEEVS
jgi:hypothetical protein